MKKTNKLDELFMEWESNAFDIFCEDGIVDENQYVGRKILFVMKDVHLDDENRKKYEKVGKLDMRKHVCNKEEWRTWNPIALWSKALLDENVKGFEQIKSEVSDKLELRKKYLSRIAFVNLKKEAGKSQVSNECVFCYTEKDAEYIEKEIEIISPDIIISCGSAVFEALHSSIFKKCPIDKENKIQLNEKMSNYGNVFDIAKFYNLDKPLYVVEYRHPVDYGRGSCTAEEHFDNMLKIRQFAFNY